MADSDVMAMLGIKFDKDFSHSKLGTSIVYQFLSSIGPNIYYIAISFILIFQKVCKI